MTERSGVIEVTGASRPDINTAKPYLGVAGEDSLSGTQRSGVEDKESRPERPSAKRGRQQLARIRTVADARDDGLSLDDVRTGGTSQREVLGFSLRGGVVPA